MTSGSNQMFEDATTNVQRAPEQRLLAGCCNIFDEVDAAAITCTASPQ